MEKIFVTQSSMPPYEEYIKEISPIWDTKILTNMGPIYIKFQEELKRYLNVKNVEMFVNGHLALMVALKALELKGEVITTPFTFASTTNAIIDSGLTPVFCDIDPKTFCIDVNKIESLITDKTCAILPVHVYGSICDMEKIQQIALRHNLKVVYDAAHAFAVENNGTNITNYGDVSMISFHATKVFNTIEGGALVFKDERLLEKVKEYRNFGLKGEQVEVCGLNAKMNEFQAAMGICNLRHIQDDIAKRKNISNEYDEILREIEGIESLEFKRTTKRNYAYYPVVINKEYGLNREELINILNEKNVFPRKYFYPITNEFNAYKGKYAGETPIAKDISERILCLPIYSELTISQVNYICDIIKNRG